MLLGGHAEFVDYFVSQWVEALPNWFEGAAPGFPSTNNANESVNGKLKSVLKKTPLGGFLQHMLKIVKDASTNSAMHTFAVEPPLLLDVQTRGYNWLLSTNVVDDIVTEYTYDSQECDGRIQLKRKTVYYIK